MDRNFARALPLVLKHEGGWSDHPKDPGGATMKGVTLATFRRYVKPDATREDLRAITDAQLATVYYRNYWAACNCQGLPSGLDYAVFDYAVNSGPGRATRALQRLAGAVVDGRIGPATLATVARTDTARLIETLCDERLAFLHRLPGWPVFGRGWNRRVTEVCREALRMVGKPADVERVVERVTVPTPVPVVPEAVDTAIRSEVRKGGWSLAWLGGLGSLLTGAMSGDWRAVLATAMAVMLTFGLGLVFRRRIIAAIADIRQLAQG